MGRLKLISFLMPRHTTTSSDIVYGSDPWFSESALSIPGLSFSFSASSDEDSSFPSSDQFFPGGTPPKEWDLSVEPIGFELLSEHSLSEQYSCPEPPLIFSQSPPSLASTVTHLPPRKLRKRPPLRQLNITSVPFPPPNIPTNTPLLGTWRRYDTPIDSASSSPSRVTDGKIPWQLPTPSVDVNKNIVPQSTSTTCPVRLKHVFV